MLTERTQKNEKKTSKNQGERIEKVKKQLEEFREQNRKRSHIPERIWQKVVGLYPEYSIHKISRTLPIDYPSLKKRGLELPEKNAPPKPPAFIQLEIPSSPTSAESKQNEWSIEIENLDGAKMKIGVKSAQVDDIVAICQNFLRS